ncbi:hypothetical protein ABI59_23665 [Acidobacteria bacterium Mor1]|nr:hypothetical protein ABI59_23665 [Acidobacteria bacterium Mor1]
MSAEIHSKLRGTSPTRRLPGRNATKADVLVYRLDEREYAVKDYSARSWWVRRWIGRPSIRRESAAYRAAAGAHGLAPFHGTPGPLSLVTGWLPARPLAEHPRGEVPAEAFDRLGEVVAGLHELGVALGDLHHRDILLAVDGRVFVVDLATALVLGDRPGPLRRSLFRRMAERDRVTVARLRARYLGQDEQAAMEAVGVTAARRYARTRRLKRLWNRIRGK